MISRAPGGASRCETLEITGAVTQQLNSCGSAGTGERRYTERAREDGAVTIRPSSPRGAAGRVFPVPGGGNRTRYIVRMAGGTSDSGEIMVQADIYADVRDFGAEPNDYRDDRAAIQAALNSNYASIYFAPGTYDVAGSLTLNRSGVRLWGDINPDGSRPARLYRHSGVDPQNPSILYVGGGYQTGIRVRNLTVEQLFFQGELKPWAFSVQLGWADSVRFHNNRVRNIGAIYSAPEGLGAAPNRYITVSNNLIDSEWPRYMIEGSFGINIAYSDSVQIRHNEVYNVSNGIYLWGGNADPRSPEWVPGFYVSNVEIRNNLVMGTGAGIAAVDGEHVTVMNNHVEHCRDVCLDAEGGADILFQSNTAKYAGTAALSVYFYATGVHFIDNTVEQKGYVPDYGDLDNWESWWPVGRAMFAVRRDGGHALDTIPESQTMTVYNNRFTYTGASGLGEVRKVASHWVGIQGNIMHNTVIRVDEDINNNNGAVDISGNTMSFTRSLGGEPAIRAGRTHRGAYPIPPGELVIINNTITSEVSQSGSAAIFGRQTASGGTHIGSTIRDNSVSRLFTWDVHFQNDNTAHQWYIGNNGGRIRRTGNTYPSLVVTPN